MHQFSQLPNGKLSVFFSPLLRRDVGYDEKRLSLIRRVDFAWAIEKDDNKKQKKSSKESSKPWQWQGMVENLQLAHQELSIIIDLINTVSHSRIYYIYNQMWFVYCIVDFRDNC